MNRADQLASSKKNMHKAGHLCAGLFWLAAACPGAALAQQNTTYAYAYDPHGNIQQVTDPLSRITRYAHDSLNRLIEIAYPGGIGSARIDYDGQNNVIKFRDPQAQSTVYTYDGLGNRLSLVSPDTGTSTYTYDSAGNLKTSTDAKGQTTAYRYDALNRVVEVNHGGGLVVAYGYDEAPSAIGQLTRITDPTGSTRYEYDGLGRIDKETRVIDGTTFVTSYRYDAADRLTGVTYPSGRTLEYVRDTLGRITRITTVKDGVSQPLVNGVTYQPFGGEKTVTYANRTTYTRSYDLDGRIASYTLHDQTQALTYDAASRIRGIADAANASRDSTFDYDALDRLTSHLRPNNSRTYVYDAVGNRTKSGNGAVTTTYGYKLGSNRLTSISGTPARAIASDPNGSITNNGVSTFAYDVRGRMVSATSAAGTVQYRINGLGQRVQKITANGTTTFHYDLNGKLIAESNGTSVTEYVYLNDMPIAVLR